MHVYSPDSQTYEAFVLIFYLGSPAGTGLLGRSPEGPPAPLGPSLSAASNLHPQRPGGQNSALTGGRGPGTCRRVWAARRHARLWFRGPWPGGALHGKAGHRTRRPRHPAAAPLAWTDHEWRGGGRSRSGPRGSPTPPGCVGLTPALGLLADDHSRVLLTPEGGHSGSDYINASPIVSAPDARHLPGAPAGRVRPPGRASPTRPGCRLVTGPERVPRPSR